VSSSRSALHSFICPQDAFEVEAVGWLMLCGREGGGAGE
jgi:hypothetical protein